jgi:folate-binding protein YgfZ
MVSDGDRGIILIEEHRVEGAVFGPEGESTPPRHYGDPAAEYAAATSAAVVVDRSERGRFHVTGRAPSQMLEGILTARVPAAPATQSHGGAVGQGAYSAVLTPKGRMITDLRVLAVGGAGESLLLDVPAPGVHPLVAHLRRSLPPRLARLEDVSAASAMVTVVGPAAPEAVAAAGRGLLPGADPAAVIEALNALGDLAYLWSGASGTWVVVVGAAHGGMAALDILGDADTVRAWWRGLLAAGVRPAGQGVFETLRVEGGQPAFGVDMDEDTLPPEAGIQDQAIDHRKGCYTGQEVIVRIRDRGHVNRRLRGLLFGDVPTPAAGTPLFQVGQDRARGHVTSAVSSPRLGQVIGMGYVRRELEPPTEVRLGSPDGPSVAVRSLDSGWGPPPG